MYSKKKQKKRDTSKVPLSHKKVTTQGSSLVTLPMLKLESDHSVTTPWVTDTYNNMSVSAEEASPKPLSAVFFANGAVDASATQQANPVSEANMEDLYRVIKEKIRNVGVLQRKKRREILRSEDEAYKDLVRQMECSAASVTAFVAFRENLVASKEQRNRYLEAWIKESFYYKITKLVSEEELARQSILRYEQQLRMSRRCFEWLSGAKMRFERDVKALVHAEELRRRYIARCEMREAFTIPVLRPYVLAFEKIEVLGQCPFVSLLDCPFYSAGGGYNASHYAFTTKGKPEKILF